MKIDCNSLTLCSELRIDEILIHIQMRKGIHPEYKPVVFQDLQSEFSFLTKSTMTSEESITWEDGNEYPLIKVEVTSASHPFYTGKKIFLDTAGRVEKFNKRYKK